MTLSPADLVMSTRANMTNARSLLPQCLAQPRCSNFSFSRAPLSVLRVVLFTALANLLWPPGAHLPVSASSFPAEFGHRLTCGCWQGAEVLVFARASATSAAPAQARSCGGAARSLHGKPMQLSPDSSASSWQSDDCISVQAAGQLANFSAPDEMLGFLDAAMGLPGADIGLPGAPAGLIDAHLGLPDTPDSLQDACSVSALLDAHFATGALSGAPERLPGASSMPEHLLGACSCSGLLNAQSTPPHSERLLDASSMPACLLDACGSGGEAGWDQLMSAACHATSFSPEPRGGPAAADAQADAMPRTKTKLEAMGPFRRALYPCGAAAPQGRGSKDVGAPARAQAVPAGGGRGERAFLGKVGQAVGCSAGGVGGAVAERAALDCSGQAEAPAEGSVALAGAAEGGSRQAGHPIAGGMRWQEIAHSGGAQAGTAELERRRRGRPRRYDVGRLLQGAEQELGGVVVPQLGMRTGVDIDAYCMHVESVTTMRFGVWCGSFSMYADTESFYVMRLSFILIGRL